MKQGKPRKRSFWHRLTNLTEASNQAKAVDLAQPRRASPVDPVDLVGFARKLKTKIESQGVVTAGSVHVINLDDVRALVGDQWAQLADQVDSTAQHILRRRLTADDMFLRFDGPLFLIVFEHLDESVARTKCAMIAAEIERSLVGWRPEFKAAQVTAAVARVDAADVAVERLDVGNELRSAISRLAIAPASDQTAVPQTAETGGKTSGAGADPWIVEAQGQAEPKPLPALSEWYYENFDFEVSGVTFVYWPMWHVRRNAIGTFHCTAALPVVGGKAIVGNILESASPGLIAMVDAMTLDRVARDIEALLAKGHKALLSLPVHFETLANRKLCREFINVCRRLSDPARQHLMFELSDLPDGVPIARLMELLASIRPFCRAVNLRTRLRTPRLDGLEHGHLYAVGIAMSHEEIDEAEAIFHLNRFVAMTGKLGLRSYVHGMRSRSLVVGALGADFDFVGGMGVASNLDHPQSAYRFETADVYAELLGDGAFAHEVTVERQSSNT